jgi:hypothetical protein
VKHEILQDLKRVASDLGHVPSREEYREHGQYSDRQLRNHYGTFTQALHACGLQPEKQIKQPKIKAEELFGVDLLEHLIEYHQMQPKPLPREGTFTPTAVVGDLHFPFTNLNTLTAFFAWLVATKPMRIVQVGDLYDMLSQSKFPRSQNIFTPKQEMEIGHKMARDFWAKVQELVPGIECHQILGNHDVRPLKRILEAYPEGEMFFSIDKYFDFPGVTTHMDARQEVVLDGIIFHHGFRTGLGAHRDFNLQSTVVGHTHVGGVTHRPIRGHTLFELNAGYMGDPESKALSYTSGKITKWTQGWGYIDEWGARFIAV